MTGVADTRLLLTLEFPPTEETKKRTEDLVQREDLPIPMKFLEHHPEKLVVLRIVQGHP